MMTWSRANTLVLTISRSTAFMQGLKLVHFPAQLTRFLWDRGCCRGYLGGVKEVLAGIMGCLGCTLCRKRHRLS
jgi:hypothetical protein